MSEVANISEILQNTVPVEQTVLEETAAQPAGTPTPAETEAESPTVTKKQVVNNNIEGDAGAGDAGTSAAEMAKAAESSPKVENKKTPVKRTPSKRMSFIERAQKESEELVKNMGGSLELDGGRRTRSSARGTPTRGTAVSTPPPAKKARSSPANASNTPSRGRGRGRKIDISEETEEAKEVTVPQSNKTPEKAKTPDKKHLPINKPKTIVEESPKSINKSSVSTEVAEKSTEKDKAKIEATVSNDEQSKDKTDAKNDVIEVNSEEKYNDGQITTSKEVGEGTQAVLKNNDTLMETDEPLLEETPQSTSAASSEPAELQGTSSKTTPPIAIEASVKAGVDKQPTPEPMDVDSNSKSSDVELVESASAVLENPIEKSAQAPTAVKNTVPLTETAPNEAEGLDTVLDAESSNNANNVDSTQVVASNVPPTAPPAFSVVGSAAPNSNALNATKKIEESSKVEGKTSIPVGPDAVNEVNANIDECAKPENDLCVPKVVSPSISNANNDGTVTTIL